MKHHRCWAEVDLRALRENLAWIRHRVGPRVRIISVVKADAYGHGLKQIAALLMQSGTDVFGVANLTEAQAIRSVGKGWPILMLGATLPAEVESTVREEVMPTLSTLEEARLFSAVAIKLRKRVRLHLKIDTGMGRLGATPKQAGQLLGETKRLPGLEICGIYTHFSSVEDDPVFSRQQRQQFGRLLQRLRKHGCKFEFVHANNSGALLLEQASILNAVRPGLLVYGVTPPGTRPITSSLKGHLLPALSWKCRVGLIKNAPKGATLSYGQSFIAPRPMRIATLTAGYGDGYLRSGSQRANVLIAGQRCPVLGRITMDQMLVDISALPSTTIGDEVVLIGRQGSQSITANDLAKWCGTVPWEVLTNITYRVPRVYLGGSAA
jgi:alanine racemase